MIRITPDKNGRLTQWDKDRKVVVTGLEGGAEVHFASPGDDHGAYVVTPAADGSASVPNILLTMAGTINVYVYPADYTVFAATLPVAAREKPDDYIYTETEVLNYKTLDERIGDLAKLETAAKDNLVSAINEAAKSGGEAYQTKANLTTSITAESTGEQYPSAKATYDYGQSIKSGLGASIADAKKAGTDAQTNLTTHIDEKDNPHSVTKAQVGLWNVDNTADKDKPISTATQTALNGKLDKTAVVDVTADAVKGQAADAKSVYDSLPTLKTWTSADVEAST